MLQEIFLSLSGHPSPLFTSDRHYDSTISPSEKALLSSIAHLSEVHRNLLRQTKDISSNHPSSICQAVATGISSKQLTSFQRKVLEVESKILRKDAGSVGAYNIVPLTAVVGEFSEWTRRMDWFWDIVQFIAVKKGTTTIRSGAQVMNRLRDELQTGYNDIQDVANQLIKVAETAWLKQVSAWVLYGRLPTYGKQDFFIQPINESQQHYAIIDGLLPAFVTQQAASSMLFIGRSLNQIRAKGVPQSTGSISPELRLLQTHLGYLSKLNFPIASSDFTGAILSIRRSLSRIVLQQMLPLSKIIEILHLLRDFFLLGRGEFAMAFITEADEKARSRWKRADNIGHNKREGLGSIEVKEGEVAAVLSRTWAAMSSLQGEEEDEDEMLELARDLVELHIDRSAKSLTPLRPTASKSAKKPTSTVPKPFSNLLFTVPVSLTLKIPSPLDLFLNASDLKTYSHINTYLLSIRRAHLRLTDLWKITALRRHHPAPLAPPVGSTKSGRAVVLTQRKRAKERAQVLRSAWATSSAAVFFLAETEAYLQGEVIQASWDGFLKWLSPPKPVSTSRPTSSHTQDHQDQSQPACHDPQSLADAHRLYLRSLNAHLLLNIPAFTDPLFHLLQQIDHLVALMHRMHFIWTSLDLESDAGVIDAFSDFHREEEEVREQLRVIAKRVKTGIEDVLAGLREVDQGDIIGDGGLGGESDEESEDERSGRIVFSALEDRDGTAFVPRKVGRVDRLLMKLDFGGWFGGGSGVSDEGNEVFAEGGEYIS